MSSKTKQHFDDSGSSPPVRLQTIDDLRTLPPLAWLIRDLVLVESLAVLYGESGKGKSFLALDWALHIATGRPWLGRAVTPGPVVYVVAEGGRGITKRVEAWMQHHGVNDLPTAFFVLRDVQVLDRGQRLSLEDRIRALSPRPRLLVFDTFARCFVGGEENSAQDVGAWVAAVSTLRVAGTTILAVHHSGKNTRHGERGSSALRGAADTIVKLAASGHTVTVTCDKQKDEAAFAPITLQRRQVSLRGTTSCVLVSQTEDVTTPTPLHASLERALWAIYFLGSVSSTAWRRYLEAKKKTFDNWRTALVEQKLVERIPGTGYRYRITLDGADRLWDPMVADIESGTLHGHFVTAATATPPRGGAEVAEMADVSYGADDPELDDDDEAVMS